MFTYEILRIYFIMPFPGSQDDNTLAIAYFMSRNIWWLRILFYAFVIYQMVRFIKQKRFVKLSIVFLLICIYAVVAYFLNFKLNADEMFRQVQEVNFQNAANNKVSQGKLIIGVEINGEAKAFPIEIIGYHHQVRDVIGGMEVMVTYCSVCRTGRVFNPIVNGSNLQFRLVGMDHFNAMFEDTETKSWWRQATGDAIAGPLKGKSLTEISSMQMPLKRWLELYPESLVMQADNSFLKEYEALSGYDEGTINSDLEQRDTAPWQPKSWVVSVELNKDAKAFDWGMLTEKRIINDTIGNKMMVLIMENDLQSFRAFETTMTTSVFKMDTSGLFLTDQVTNSIWNLNGLCTAGALAGTNLKSIPAYQEFYHAFEEFRK